MSIRNSSLLFENFSLFEIVRKNIHINMPFFRLKFQAICQVQFTIFAAIICWLNFSVNQSCELSKHYGFGGLDLADGNKHSLSILSVKIIPFKNHTRLSEQSVFRKSTEKIFC